MKYIVTELIDTIAHQIEPLYEHKDEREQVAWWLLEGITTKKKATLLAHRNIELSKEEQSKLDQWIKDRVEHHKPLQYILGTVPFNDLELFVEPPVLIPRPETEEWIINLINQLDTLNNKKLTILDLGCGSGAIALALAKALPQAHIFGTDISQEAIELSKKNAQHNTISNVTFLFSDLFEQLPKDLKFDLIVSNPPYIAHDEWKKLDPSVTEWEDERALVAQHHGLSIIEEIIKKAPEYLKENEELKMQGIGQLYLEFGYRQANRVKELLQKALYNHIKILQDLEGKDRVVMARI